MARPRIIESPEEMRTRGEAYFAECRASEEPITITGLVLALGLSHRDSLIEYGKREEFSDTVKSLKTECEHFCEKRALATNGAGAIFALKNYGWADKVQQEVSGPNGTPIQAEVKIEFVKPSN